MSPIGRVRLVLVRHPWIHWLTVAVVALTAATAVRSQMIAADDARAAWTDTRPVAIAAVDLAPGDPLALTEVELPAAAVPDAAIRPHLLDDPATARQFVAAGEVLVEHDLAATSGPAGAAAPGRVVVPIADPLVPGLPTGTEVAVYAEGLVLAADGRVVGGDDAAVWVEVAATDAPLVAAAAQQRTASIVFRAP